MANGVLSIPEKCWGKIPYSPSIGITESQVNALLADPEVSKAAVPPLLAQDQCGVPKLNNTLGQTKKSIVWPKVDSQSYLDSKIQLLARWKYAELVDEALNAYWPERDIHWSETKRIFRGLLMDNNQITGWNDFKTKFMQSMMDIRVYASAKIYKQAEVDSNESDVNDEFTYTRVEFTRIMIDFWAHFYVALHNHMIDLNEWDKLQNIYNTKFITFLNKELIIVEVLKYLFSMVKFSNNNNNQYSDLIAKFACAQKATDATYWCFTQGYHELLQDSMINHILVQNVCTSILRLYV